MPVVLHVRHVLQIQLPFGHHTFVVLTFTQRPFGSITIRTIQHKDFIDHNHIAYDGIRRVWFLHFPLAQPMQRLPVGW